MFSVGSVFCNDNTTVVNRYETSAPAIKEYLELIVAGLTHPDPAPFHHVRIAILFSRDKDGKLIYSIDSGVLPCEHRN